MDFQLLHPISARRHRPPTKIVSRQTLALTLLAFLTASVASPRSLSLAKDGSLQPQRQQHLQLRYHMQAPSYQARLSVTTTADWGTAPFITGLLPDRPDMAGDVVHCRWSCSPIMIFVIVMEAASL